MSEFTARKHTAWIPISNEAKADLEGMPTLTEMMDRIAKTQAAFEALPKAEQQRIKAEQKAENEAAKQARTCQHCGCDPDEHGGY